MSDVVTKKDVNELCQSMLDLMNVVNDIARTVRVVSILDHEVDNAFVGSRHVGESYRTIFVQVNSSSTSSKDEELDPRYDSVIDD